MAVAKMQLFFFSFSFFNSKQLQTLEVNLRVFSFAELLHIPPGSKDAAIFSPGGDKGSSAAPGEPDCPSVHYNKIASAAKEMSHCKNHFSTEPLKKRLLNSMDSRECCTQ